MKIETQIEFSDYTENLRALGEYKGQDVIIDGIIPGETAEVTLTDKIDDVYYGKLKKIVKASRYREKPICPYYDSCGNCSLSHVSYQARLDSKADALKKRLEFAGESVKIEPVEKVFFPYKYRNHISLFFSHKKDAVTLGYKDPRTGLVSDIDSCAVCDKWASVLIKTVKTFAGKFKIKSFSPITGEGKLAYLNAVYIDGRLILTIECVGESLMGSAWLHKELCSVFGKVNFYTAYRSDAGMQYNLIGGDRKASVRFCGKQIPVRPNMRLPVNDKLFSKAFRTIEDRIREEYTLVSGDCSAVITDLLSDNENVFIKKGSSMPVKKPLQGFMEIKDLFSDNQRRFLKTFRTKKLVVLVNDCDGIEDTVRALLGEKYGRVTVLPFDMQPQTKKLSALLFCET